MDNYPQYADESSNADLRAKLDRLEQEVESLKRRSQSPGLKPVRRRSKGTFLGLPWYDVALGPDFERGERRGYAKGILAIGDVACGGLAFGGLACGLLSVGGVSFGLIGALGGLALGCFAMGGAAIGAVAFGGAVIGYYALGGAAIAAEPLKELFRQLQGP